MLARPGATQTLSLVGATVAFALALLFNSGSAHALTHGVSLLAGSVEEGDDRFRPTAGIEVAQGDKYAGRLFVYGREFGPVIERTYIVSAVRRLPIFGLKYVHAGFGLTALMESTEIDFSGADRDASRDETKYNLGAIVGMRAEVPDLGLLKLSASWESHLYLAGEAGILLSTGRKQVIAIGAGYQIK